MSEARSAAGLPRCNTRCAALATAKVRSLCWRRSAPGEGQLEAWLLGPDRLEVGGSVGVEFGELEQRDDMDQAHRLRDHARHSLLQRPNEVAEDASSAVLRRWIAGGPEAPCDRD